MRRSTSANNASSSTSLAYSKASINKSNSSVSSLSPVIVKKKKKPILNTTFCKYDIVRECGLSSGFRIVKDTLVVSNTGSVTTVEKELIWSVFWIDTGVCIDRVLLMTPIQKINHFPGMQEICRKDYLARNLTRLNKAFPKQYRFFPKTWKIPVAWPEFKMCWKPTGTYIAKPDHGCQGKGIFLFKNIKDLNAFAIPTSKTVNQKDDIDINGLSNMIIQTYLSKPYLINDYKFDLRVYVLVTSVSPFRVFIYKEGLARFATEKYHPPSSKNIDNPYMHLTNYAINKHSDKFIQGESKRSITSVMQELKEEGKDANQLWDRICTVIIKTLISVQPQLKKTLHACSLKGKGNLEQILLGSQCFEILGFDIFLDAKLKPWLLEVNHSPSFTCDSPIDYTIKKGVIQDTLNLISIDSGLVKNFKRQEKSLVRERLLSKKKSDVVDDGKNDLGSRSNSTISAESLLSSTKSRQAAGSDPDENNEDEDDDEEDVEIKNSTILSPTEQKNILQAYHENYPPDYLSSLTAQENTKLGNFQRIFPPTSPALLSTYLKFMQAAEYSTSDDTIKTRARKQFLKEKIDEKQVQQQKQARKKAQMKIRNDNLTASSRLSVACKTNSGAIKKKYGPSLDKSINIYDLTMNPKTMIGAIPRYSVLEGKVLHFPDLNKKNY